jgi:hypothetical protein
MTETLIAELQSATCGSPELDEQIYDAIGRPGDDDPQYYSFLHGDCPPSYSTSIDAAIPGEDIVRVEYSHKTEMWTAVDWKEEEIKLTVGEAHTEALARRIAALCAREEA